MCKARGLGGPSITRVMRDCPTEKVTSELKARRESTRGHAMGSAVSEGPSQGQRGGSGMFHEEHGGPCPQRESRRGRVTGGVVSRPWGRSFKP